MSNLMEHLYPMMMQVTQIVAPHGCQSPVYEGDCVGDCDDCDDGCDDDPTCEDSPTTVAYGHHANERGLPRHHQGGQPRTLRRSR